MKAEYAVAALLVAGGLWSVPASAQTWKPPRIGDVPLTAPPEFRAIDGELDATFNVRYGANTIGPDKVWLRGYNGGLVGPTLRVRPGDTMNVQMVNALPANSANAPSPGGHHGHGGGGDMDVNDPHAFNTTNLHTHGLWVSPTGNSDNVLISLFPGDEFFNEIRVPREHPPGTHWFHAHQVLYIGRYVLHCHILDHEDQGMMQEVEVVLHPPADGSVKCDQPVDVGKFPGGNLGG